jgi:hypothetical protein
MIPFSAARRTALFNRYGGMAAYPSSASIPSKIPERLLFGACALIAGMIAIATYAGLKTDLDGAGLLAVGGIISPYGLVGWWFRRRRLRRVREREALLAKL